MSDPIPHFYRVTCSTQLEAAQLYMPLDRVVIAPDGLCWASGPRRVVVLGDAPPDRDREACTLYFSQGAMDLSRILGLNLGDSERIPADALPPDCTPVVGTAMERER